MSHPITHGVYLVLRARHSQEATYNGTAWIISHSSALHVDEGLLLHSLEKLGLEHTQLKLG